MSWDTTWRLDATTLDVARVCAALGALEASHPGTKARVEREEPGAVRCLIELPAELVERCSVLGDEGASFAHPRSYLGQIDLEARDGVRGEVSVDDALRVGDVHVDDDDEDPEVPERPCITGIAGSAGASATRIYAVSDRDGCFRHDRAAGWTLERRPRPEPRLHAVWVDPTGRAWAVGAKGTILRRDEDDVWRREDSGTEADLSTVVGRSANDVWAAGTEIILHRQGERWSRVAAPAFGAARSLCANARGLWLVGSDLPLMREDGARFVECEVPSSLTWPSRWLVPPRGRMLGLAAAGARADHLWLAGEDFALRFDGERWLVTETGLGEPRAFAVARDDDVVLVGDGGVARWNGRAWARVGGFDGCYLSACVGPEGEVLVAENDGTVMRLEQGGPVVEMRVRSNAVDNREAWGAITVLAEELVEELNGGPR